MIKLTSFIVQAVLVVLAVLLFSFFDPFGIMGRKKQTLQDTPITVSSIKEIGKFISAEYYGEVLSSLNEIYIDKLDSNKEIIKALDADFAKAIGDLKNADKKKTKKRKIENYFNEQFPDFRQNPFFDSYTEYLGKIYKEDSEKDILDKLVNDNQKILPFDETVFNDLKKKTRDLFAANKKTLKQQIVLLGRGWVKAGFDFEKFTPSNFRYVPSNKSIYMIGMKPEILSCTINPWFIPEKKVKGFELVLYTGKANDPKLMNQVKTDCLRKLRRAAMDQDILGKAQENAKQNLKTFFSLLLDGNIDNVFFVDDTLDMYENVILSDSIISATELPIIDTILSKAGTGTFDKARVIDFMNDLKERKFYFANDTSSLTCYSSFAYKTISDWTVDSSELTQWHKLKDSINASYPYEEYFFTRTDTVKDAVKKKWFDMAIDDIAKNTNQLIASRKLRLERNNKSDAKINAAAIDSVFKELKR